MKSIKHYIFNVELIFRLMAIYSTPGIHFNSESRLVIAILEYLIRGYIFLKV